MSDLKSDGALFHNNRKENEKQPDFTGKLSVTSDQIRELIDMGKSGEEVVLRLAGWKRKSKAGAHYIYVSSEIYRPKEEKQAPVSEDPFTDDEIPF